MTGSHEVIITNAAADPAAAVLGIGREQARTWLDRAKLNGRITDRLPAPYTGKRSPSGYFVLVDNTLVMGLRQSSEGGLLATSCEFFPAWLQANGRGGDERDPFTMTSAELTRMIGFSAHVLDRYTQRAAGHPEGRELTDRERREAESELRLLLSRDARAVRKPPPWYFTQTRNDFLVVGQGAELCVPMRHTPGNAQPFTALTMLHQSMDLFEKTPEELARACHFTPAALDQAAAYAPAGRRPAAWLAAQITATGTLVRHPPRGHAAHPGARFYVHAGAVFCPAAWDKQHRHPLHLLAVQRTRLPLSRRVLSWLRARLALRLS